MKKRRKKIIVWTVALVLIFYFFLPLPFITENQEIAIQKEALRFLYHSEHYGRKEKLETLYLDIGKGKVFDGFVDWDDGRSFLETEDPTSQLLTALTDFPIETKPGSALHETDPNDIIAAFRKRGERAISFGVGPVLKSLGLARCRTFYDGGGLCAAEFETFFIWTPFG